MRSSVAIESEYRTNNQNPFLLAQLVKTGVQYKKFRTEAHQIGAAPTNPLNFLFESNKLTREEYAAAMFYQAKLKICQEKSGFTSPSNLHDGLPIDSCSNASSRCLTSDKRLDASLYLDAIRVRICMNGNFEKVYRRGKFEIIDLKLLHVLDLVFHQEIAIDNVKIIMKLGHKTVHERIQKICKIMLDCSKQAK